MAETERHSPNECPVVIDRASYVIPTIGIAFLPATGGSVVAMIAGMIAGGRAVEPLSESALFVWVAATFVGGAAW